MPVPPEEIRVVGTVKSVSESLIDDSWEAMVEIPEFQSQYDIRFNKVPSYLGEILAKEKGQRVTKRESQASRLLNYREG
jgi:tRNA G37 N-methylase TrmD